MVLVLVVGGSRGRGAESLAVVSLSTVQRRHKWFVMLVDLDVDFGKVFLRRADDMRGKGEREG